MVCRRVGRRRCPMARTRTNQQAGNWAQGWVRLLLGRLFSTERAPSPYSVSARIIITPSDLPCQPSSLPVHYYHHAATLSLAGILTSCPHLICIHCLAFPYFHSPPFPVPGCGWPHHGAPPGVSRAIRDCHPHDHPPLPILRSPTLRLLPPPIQHLNLISSHPRTRIPKEDLADRSTNISSGPEACSRHGDVARFQPRSRIHIPR